MSACVMTIKFIIEHSGARHFLAFKMTNLPVFSCFRVFGVVVEQAEVQLCSFLLWNNVSGFADHTNTSNVIL